MNDAMSGLLVAACTAVAVAGIFLLTARVKRKRIEALRALCAQRGWTYQYDSGALRHGHLIEGDGWVFASVSRSSGREAAPGSSDWDHSSEWRAVGEDPGRGSFVLGSRQGGRLDIAMAPPQLLSRYLGGDLTGLQASPAGERLDVRYLLFSRERKPGTDLLPSRAQELLLDWPEKYLLVVRSSPARLALQVHGKRLETPEDVARFIELGESFLDR